MARWARRSWRLAQERAERTPASRNRYVDFLRAASIVVVVIGHWLMAAPTVEHEEFTLSDILGLAPWSQWLTWVFQVMPLFFIVGGYANAASWSSHWNTGRRYDAWVSRRLHRLVRPLVPLLVGWCVLAVLAHGSGLNVPFAAAASRVAFIPLWFLAVYALVVVLAPWTYALYLRYGIASFWALALAAAAVDALAVAPQLEMLRRLNYAFVWLALHQFGHAWRLGGIGGRPARCLLLAAVAFTLLVLFHVVAGYPISMVTVPGDPTSNTNPPTLALLALGISHGGLVIAAEARARRWLERPRTWTATVVVNLSILTIYLWHATVMVLLVALLELSGGVGLTLTPNSPAWWLARPFWIAALVVLLSLTVVVFGRFETPFPTSSAAPPSAWRSVAGAVAVCVGLIWLGSEGIASPNTLGLRAAPVLVTFAGTLLVTVTPRRRPMASSYPPEPNGGKSPG